MTSPLASCSSEYLVRFRDRSLENSKNLGDTMVAISTKLQWQKTNHVQGPNVCDVDWAERFCSLKSLRTEVDGAVYLSEADANSRVAVWCDRRVCLCTCVYLACTILNPLATQIEELGHMALAGLS